MGSGLTALYLKKHTSWRRIPSQEAGSEERGKRLRQGDSVILLSGLEQKFQNTHVGQMLKHQFTEA